MTREEKIKQFEQWIELAKQSALLADKMFTPPSDQEQMAYLSTCSDTEVEGIYRWGSPQGRRLAKIECLKRGIIKPNWFKRRIAIIKANWKEIISDCKDW
jgi:hypothetical protein